MLRQRKGQNGRSDEWIILFQASLESRSEFIEDWGLKSNRDS